MRRAALALAAAATAAGCGPSFDTAAPKITEGPAASVVRDTTATIVWLTNERANSLVEYGETDDYGTVEIDNLYLTTHVVTIKNLQPQTTYHLRAVSYDLFGNGPARSGDLTITTLAPLPPPDLVVSEVLVSPTVATGEYIEIYNDGLDEIDLTGFTFTDGDSEDTLQAFEGGSTTLSGGDYAVIVDPDYATGTYTFPPGTVLMTTADASLGNGLSEDDPVSLFAPGDSEPASTYGTPDSADGFPSTVTTGHSVERIDLQGADEPGNWCESVSPGGTPGETNTCT